MPPRSFIQKILIHGLVLILMCLFFLLALRFVCADWPRLELKALDRLRPDTFKYLCPRADLSRLKLYEVYFDRVDKRFGAQIPEIAGLRGYCAYQRGDWGKAQELYQKALAGNSYFFWYYYNSGIINMQQRQYDKALLMFQSALNLDLRETFMAIVSSNKVYMPVVRDYMDDVQHGLAQQLEDGKQMAMRLAVLAKLGMDNPYAASEQDLPGVMCY